jgi:signal transduction histidine kinase
VESFDQLKMGLAVIERRSEHLARVMSDYAKLARTAAPRFRPLSVRDWVARNARLWPELVLGEGGAPDVVLAGDEALLDQVLLNLVKNALEAAASQRDAAPLAAGVADEPVTLSWGTSGRWLHLSIADRGPGLQGDIDPFLPFVTSKPQGSGIGLALCREIADAHGGRLELVNRSDGPGCVARLTLPLQPRLDSNE